MGAGKSGRLEEAPGALDDIAAEVRLWPSDWKCPNCAYAPSRTGQFVRLAPDLDDLDEGFALESFDILERSEEGHFWFTTRNQLIEWLIHRYALTTGRAIEIGCGTGFVGCVYCERASASLAVERSR